MINLAVILVAIPVLCLPSTLFGVRELLPVQLQNNLFRFIQNVPVLANLVTYTFYVVAVLGVEMCVLAAGLFVILLFFKTAPLWLKIVMAALVLASIYGVLVVRHVFGR